MKDFLLELRSEEIPARMQKGARAELEKLFRRELDGAGVAFGELAIFSTPRRLALIVRDLPDATQAVSEEAKGPPVGAPDQAVDGFCRKNGVTRGQLEVREVKGRETYFAVIETPGRATRNLLAEAIPAIIRDFSWPKSMRWGTASTTTESLRWVRPLSGIVALLGTDIVECEVHGVTSGAVTLGHRFHHTGDVTIGDADDYAVKLRAAHVIVDHEERAALIRDGARLVAEKAGLVLVEDEGLVVENAGLTEWPIPLLGRFDEEFLAVPPEVVQLTARVNQKYFVCESDNGKLANAFICTANIEAADGGAAIVDGNRKVLAARLADARFFWDVDRQKTLAQHAEGLARITFHEKLGTVADKVERVAKLARWLVEEGVIQPPAVRPEPVEGLSSTSEEKSSASTSSARTVSDLADAPQLADWAEQAARLCKADLVTEMVGEFPELQGLMGGYYARAEGLPDAVADAIRDHYKPIGQGDDVPTAPVTVAVSLADKLDTLVSFFAIDEKPTGSKDPFALRRAAIGVLITVLHNSLRFSLPAACQSAVLGLGHYHDDELTIEGAIGTDESDSEVREIRRKQRIYDAFKTEFPDAIDLEWSPPLNLDDYFSPLLHVSIKGKTGELLDFFADRLKVQQREAGVRHDLIDAVFALGGEDDLVRLLARVHALQNFMETEDGANLLAGYTRAANILKKEGVEPARSVTPAKAGVSGEGESREEMPASAGMTSSNKLPYTPEPAEKALIEALDAAQPQAARAVEDERFEDAMAALATLRAPIDRFFEDVIVNDENADKRAARLALLARFRAAVHNVADFSRIEG